MLSTQETSRLHRWAMWRMTVNEGIISCMRPEDNSHGVHSPGAHYVRQGRAPSESSDQVISPMQELPFFAPEQFQIARRLNLRERYGSIPGLSDDAYFIFGLPRISVGNDIPEVTSTGTRSFYGSVSDLGAVDYNSNRMGLYGNFNSEFPEFGPTPDERSLASNNDFEVQRINGYPVDWRNLASPPVPRLNLYSIQEENDHHHRDSGRERIDTYPFNISPSRSENYFPSPTSSPRRGDHYTHGPPSPTRTSNFEYPPKQTRAVNSSPAPPLPKRNYSPSPGPSPRGWGSGYSPYMPRSRPTVCLGDEHIERRKREAYYDWDEGYRMGDKYMPDFISPGHHRYS